MKKMKTRTKLIGAVAALTVAVALSAGTTFAWFTSNATSTVGTIDATVKTGGDTDIYVMVGHDTSSGTFKTGLDDSDLSTAISQTLGANGLEALTNNDDLTSAPSLVTASWGDSGYAVNDTAASSGYVKIPLTIKTSEAANVILQNDSSSYVTTTSVVNTPVSEWRSTDITSYNAGSVFQLNSPYTAYACNAVRVGFTAASGELDTNTVKGKTTESSFKVWSPNEAMYDGGEVTTDTPSSETVDRSETTTGVVIKTNTNNYWANNLARDYADYVYGTSSSFEQVEYTNNYIAPEDSNNNVIATTALGGTTGDTSCYAYIYVYLWIEGTDGDCLNNILDQAVSLSLSLTAEATGGVTNTLSTGANDVTNVEGTPATAGSYTYTAATAGNYTFSVTDMPTGWTITATDGNSTITLTGDGSTQSDSITTTDDNTTITVTVSYQESGTEVYQSTGVALTITEPAVNP